jgi:hypothetical protein
VLDGVRARTEYMIEELVDRDGIIKLLRSPGIDSKESNPPDYEACWPGKEPCSYSVPSPHGLL